MMSDKSRYHTAQECFWAGDFGTEYINRNSSDQLVAANISLFANALKCAGKVSSCIEFGANIGLNLQALQNLYPNALFMGLEINPTAAKALVARFGRENVYKGSVFDYPVEQLFDLSLIKTVLIHMNPSKLEVVYEKLYQSSKHWILICEYYNPTPVSVLYRGHEDRLFKRDFAGEMLDRYSDLSLADYGFVYHRDPAFPQDDISWFLLKKGTL